MLRPMLNNYGEILSVLVSYVIISFFVIVPVYFSYIAAYKRSLLE